MCGYIHVWISDSDCTVDYPYQCLIGEITKINDISDNDMHVVTGNTLLYSFLLSFFFSFHFPLIFALGSSLWKHARSN